MRLAVELPVAEENVMRSIKIRKVVVNIGVGQSGERVERAARLLESLTDQKPSYRHAKRTIRDFGIHKGEPIGVMVTLRGRRAVEGLKRLLAAKGNRLSKSSFDENGNCSFGIKEHIEIPGVKYDPNIGIFGMDVSVVLERPGYRVKYRRRSASKIGSRHKVTKEEAADFLRRVLGVEVY